jgi:hypothetical protein
MSKALSYFTLAEQKNTLTTLIFHIIRDEETPYP